MKVVVAGLGRTGTFSLTEAMALLGFTPLAQEELLRRQQPLLRRVVAQVRGDEPFDPQGLQGFDAALGWPLCWLYDEMLDAFPDAKCVLNVRDTERWFASVSRAWGILRPLTKLPFPPAIKLAGQMLDLCEEKMGGPLDKDRWMAAYDAHNQAVKDRVPADRLLVYELGSGWEPLCAFLDVDVPSTPFPSGNSSGNDEFKTKVKQLLQSS